MQKECFRCGYKWLSRKDNPKECPKCKKRMPTITIITAEDANGSR